MTTSNRYSKAKPGHRPTERGGGYAGRFSSRLWLGVVALLALVGLGYALLRPGVTFSPSAPQAGQPRSGPATSESGPGEWAMDGYNPGRTRALSADIALPKTRQSEVRVANDEGTGSPVAIAQNTMFVESEHLLRAVDVRTGKERWSFAEVGRYISPAVAGDTVFFRAEAANQGEIFAVDLATGAERWSFTPRRISGPETNYWGGHLTSPVIMGGDAFVGAGKEVYSLDAATGEKRWEYPAADYISSSPALADGRVFISDARYLYAIDQKTGKLAWKSPAAFAPYFSPVVAGQTVVLRDGDKIVALRTSDGARRWIKSFQGETAVPAGAQGSSVFAKSSATLYALDVATGRERWRFRDPNFVSFPAIAGKQMFVSLGSTGQTKLAVLDVATGKSVWRQPVSNLATAAPVIAGKTVYVRTTDGRVLGLSD